MSNLKEYTTVRVVKLLRSSNEYNGWNINQRNPQIGDVGTLIDVLHAPNILDGYIVECVASDGTTIWLSDLLAKEIESIDNN